MSSIELERVSAISSPKAGNRALSIRIRGRRSFNVSLTLSCLNHVHHLSRANLVPQNLANIEELHCNEKHFFFIFVHIFVLKTKRHLASELQTNFNYKQCS